MKIYPAIDLHDGKCVRLFQGDYNEVTDYGDPVEVAKKWKAMGAKYLHLVDLDGAKSGSFVNLEIVKRIIKETGMKCELGGGIREISHIKTLLDIGLDRVILGSAALNLEFVKEAVSRFGSDKIVVGIDCKNYMVATHGWLNQTNLSASDFALKLKEIGIKIIIFTDISKDGTLQGINIEQSKKLVDDTQMKIVASGGARSLRDVEAAMNIGCDGIILGKSIYSGEIKLDEAIIRFEG